MSRPGPILARRGGFTLIELLIATAIFAIIVLAMNAAFYSALRLRATTEQMMEQTIPLNHALELLKQDLRCTLITGGMLGGPIEGTVLGVGNSQLQFFTADGRIDEEQLWGESMPAALTTFQFLPWPDVQMVTYYLRDGGRAGKDLIRGVTRNLLPSSLPDLTEQPLLHGVQSFQVSYFDGFTWYDVWDSTTQYLPAPIAIKVDITFAQPLRTSPVPLPVELLVPLDMQGTTNMYYAAATSSTSTGSTTPGGATTPATPTGGAKK